MTGTTQWVRVSCETADVIRASAHVHPYSGRSDLHGEFGEPEVFTEWGIRDRDISVLREHRFPGPDLTGPDRKSCEHYVPAPEVTP